MIEIVAVLAVSYVLGSLTCYGVHTLLHKKIFKRAYRDHAFHHFKIYPPSDFLSEEYREPPTGAGQGKYYLAALAAAFLPMLMISASYYLLSVVVAALILKLNAVVHDALHIKGHRWEKYPIFLRLRELHYFHHVDITMNYSIVDFTFDKVFKTYTDR